MAGEAGPVGGGFALFDPLLGHPPLVAEADDSPGRPGQSGNDEDHPREQPPEVMLNLGDHPPRPVPRGGPIEREVKHVVEQEITGEESESDVEVLVDEFLDEALEKAEDNGENCDDEDDED